MIKRTVARRRGDVEYDQVLGDVARLVTASHAAAARSVNAVMTATYWLVGRRIVESEQRGAARAGYGERLISRLSEDLTQRFGRGYGRANLFQMRTFFLSRREIVQTLSGQSSLASQVPQVAKWFPLPWSHYVRLFSVKNVLARSFYEAEALLGGWSLRQLDRQIQTRFYERTALSKNKTKALQRDRDHVGDAPEPPFKDPYVLEFANLKDEPSEGDLEDALVKRLEDLLLELGSGFTFVGRQRRLRIGNSWYRVDLVLFHRGLRCLVVVDLKLGAFTHADAGQMHLYLNYAREHWTLPGENAPVGLILCAENDQAVAKYALAGLPNKVLSAEYRTALPNEKALAAELRRSQLELDARRPRRRSA